MLLKTAYTFFIALLFAVFIGVGIAAFYEAPQYPSTPALIEKSYYPIDGTGTPSAELIKEQP